MKSDVVANKRVEKYMPLVKHVIKKFRRAWDFREHVWDDLYGVAYCALVKADRDFDFNRKVKFETHAYGRIRNAVRNEIRGMMCWTRNPGSLDRGWDRDERKYSFVKSCVASPYRRVERREIGDILVGAFRGLSFDDVAIVMDYYVHGKTDSEISDDLRCLWFSVGRAGIAYRRGRALGKLKEALWQGYVESDLL